MKQPKKSRQFTVSTKVHESLRLEANQSVACRPRKTPKTVEETEPAIFSFPHRACPCPDFLAACCRHALLLAIAGVWGDSIVPVKPWVPTISFVRSKTPSPARPLHPQSQTFEKEVPIRGGLSHRQVPTVPCNPNPRPRHGFRRQRLGACGVPRTSEDVIRLGSLGWPSSGSWLGDLRLEGRHIEEW